MNSIAVRVKGALFVNRRFSCVVMSKSSRGEFAIDDVQARLREPMTAARCCYDEGNGSRPDQVWKARGV